MGAPSAKSTPIGIRLDNATRDMWEAAGRPPLRAWLEGRAASAALAGGGVETTEVPLAWIAGPYLYQSGERAGQVMNPRTRFPEDKQEELRQSLAEYGQRDALKIHVPAGSPQAHLWTDEAHPEIRVVDGHRRWMVAEAAGLTSLRAEVGTYTDLEALRTARITGTDRANLSPMDIIRANLVEWELAQQTGKLQSKLATELGYNSNTTFSNDLRLLKLPAAAQDLIDDGVLGKSHAKDFLLPFVDLPAGTREHLFGRVCAVLSEEVAASDNDGSLTRSKVRAIVGRVAADLSLPVQKGVAPVRDTPLHDGQKEEQPLFTEADHDADQADGGCGCGAPRFLYFDYAPQHRRCFNLPWARGRNADLREVARAESQRRLNEARQPAQARPESSAAPIPSRGDSPEPGRRDPDPSPRGAALPAPVASPEPGTMSPEVIEEVAPPAYQPGDVLSATARMEHDPAGTWVRLGTIDSTGVAAVSPGNPVPLFPVVQPEDLRYAESATDRSIVVWCARPDAAEVARGFSRERFSEHYSEAQTAFAHELRRDAASVDLASPASLAALLLGLGRVGATFLPETARALGHDVPESQRVEDLQPALERMERSELQTLVRVVSHLFASSSFQRIFEYGRWCTDRASREAARAASMDLANLVERVPPRMLPDAAARRVEARLLAAEKNALAAIRALAPGDEIPRALAELREAHAAASEWMGGGGVVPAGMDLEGDYHRIAVFLREHPGVLQYETPDERLRCRINSIDMTLATARVAASEGDRDVVMECAAKLETFLPLAEADIDEGAEVPMFGPRAMRDARAFLEWVRGEGETLFGDVVVVEPVAGEEEPRADGPVAMAAGRLLAALLAAIRAAENAPLLDDGSADRAALAARHREAREFMLANALPSVVGEQMFDAIERAESVLAAEVD